ncbi:MAG: hypothetical protein ACU841_02005 [Gammaproteobacteria bacterium]
MPVFNASDFLNVQQLDLENKLYLPTAKLYSQVRFQLNALYRDVADALRDVRSVVESTAREIFDRPLETMTAWYEQAGNRGADLYSQTWDSVVPVYQNWHARIVTGKEHTLQHLKSFWNNPEQTIRAALEPVNRAVASASELAEKNLQLFLDNPEQYAASAMAPVIDYLSTMTENSKAVLINSYSALVELLGMLIAQPSATLEAVYTNVLSALLDVYYAVISSLLATL